MQAYITKSLDRAYLTDLHCDQRPWCSNKPETRGPGEDAATRVAIPCSFLLGCSRTYLWVGESDAIPGPPPPRNFERCFRSPTALEVILSPSCSIPFFRRTIPGTHGVFAPHRYTAILFLLWAPGTRLGGSQSAWTPHHRPDPSTFPTATGMVAMSCLPSKHRS
jgi:hypothetical protein